MSSTLDISTSYPAKMLVSKVDKALKLSENIPTIDDSSAFPPKNCYCSGV
jgi:hypothetical protein